MTPLKALSPFYYVLIPVNWEQQEGVWWVRRRRWCLTHTPLSPYRYDLGHQLGGMVVTSGELRRPRYVAVSCGAHQCPHSRVLSTDLQPKLWSCSSPGPLAYVVDPSISHSLTRTLPTPIPLPSSQPPSSAIAVLTLRPWRDLKLHSLSPLCTSVFISS